MFLVLVVAWNEDGGCVTRMPHLLDQEETIVTERTNDKLQSGAAARFSCGFYRESWS